MKSLAVALLFLIALTPASAANRKFKGIITDSMCAEANHSGMRMGSNDAECVNACVEAHGALYVLYNGKTSYPLSDQQLPEKFAGKKVTVTGTLDPVAKVIHVVSISGK